MITDILKEIAKAYSELEYVNAVVLSGSRTSAWHTTSA